MHDALAIREKTLGQDHPAVSDIWETMLPNPLQTYNAHFVITASTVYAISFSWCIPVVKDSFFVMFVYVLNNLQNKYTVTERLMM